MVTLGPADSSTSNSTTYGVYRSIRGTAYAKLDDVSFHDGRSFTSFSMQFQLIDSSNVVHYQGLLRRYWATPTSFTTLSGGNGAQWASLRVRVTNSWMTYGNGSICNGCPYTWRGQLTWS